MTKRVGRSRAAAAARRRQSEAEETLRAIRAGEVDALVITRAGEEVITLAGTELAYHVVFDQMNEGAVTLTPDGTIGFCNRRFAAMVDLPAARVIGASLSRFVAPASLAAFEALRDGGSRDNARGDLEFRTDAGAVFPVAISFAPLHAEHGVETLGIVGVIRDITERKQEEDRRKRLVEQVMTAQDAERRRIARELHDETGQSLTALLVGLRTIEAARTRSAAIEMARQLRPIVAQTLGEVGRLSRGLHPSTLDEVGLAVAVVNQGAECAHRHGLIVDTDVGGLDAATLPLHLQTTIYRILQEALTNVAKHARARRVGVRLALAGPVVELRVSDDGIGLGSLAAESAGEGGRRGLGVEGMRERAALLGGSLEVESRTGAGTTITARFPLSGA